MFEKIVTNHVVFYCVGIAIGIGILARIIVGTSLNRLVRAASNVSKSNHPLMRLVRAKFEHACMVSDKVQNISLFVEKYIYEYKTLGIKLQSWRNLEKTMIWACGGFTIVGGYLSYTEHGMSLEIYQYIMSGIAGVLLLVMMQMTANEGQKLSITKMYMTDFLENTFAHRYEKTMQKEREQQQMVIPEAIPASAPVEAAAVEVLPDEEEESVADATRIREILEKFLT